jgi:hypothetical protein
VARQRPARDDDAVRITSAAPSPQEDLRRRQKRYLLSMSLRSLCFVGAVVAGLAGVDWLWPLLIAGALVLPYIAVVLANVQATRMQEHDLGDAAYEARALGGGSPQRPLGASSDRG